jgi:tRNA A-37 threonylcarbamoyl transferase component Bud32
MYREEIEKRLNEQISSISLLKETSCSLLFHIKANKEYVLKETKSQNINEEFLNHKTIYDCWAEEKQDLDFRIPALFLKTADEKAYLMEYIDGTNLFDLLLRNSDNATDAFRLVGESLHQYHQFATRCLVANRADLQNHNSIRQILKSRRGKKFRRILNSFDNQCYRTILKDVTASNILLDKNNHIYLVDFQKIFYYAPFYYDLARFIDTTKVFCLVKKPMFYAAHYRTIQKALNNFIKGYDQSLDFSCLDKMHLLHRAEHIQMKANCSIVNAFILKLIYSILRP